MIGAMKRKASLSLSETCSTQQSPQGMNCHEAYQHQHHGTSPVSGGSIGGAAGLHGPKPEKRIRWDGPRTQSLIDHYRTHEYLWNPKLADYKNDKKRTQCLEAWLEANHLEKDLVNEVKMKLHGLRTSFGHQLKLESSSMADGEKEEGGFQSKWQWYNQLAFLKETMVFRSSSSNNNHSPSDSPPPSIDHVHGHMIHHNPGVLHDDTERDVKMDMNAPLNMQVIAHSHYSQPHDIQDYLVQSHHHSQPHNLSVSAVPVPLQAHEPHPSSLLPHARKEDDDPLSYHHSSRITATPPMAHMNLSSHSQPPVSVVAHQQSEYIAEKVPRYQSGCCSCSGSERPRSAVGEKLGRLVEETFNNLHPDYQEMAKIEIQQVLGKYLQKPVP